MKVPAGPAPGRSDHSPRCGNLVCSPRTAPWFVRDVSQQELNLLQFTTGLMAKTGTRPTEVVRCEGRNPTVLCFLFHDAPNDLGSKSSTPNPASLIDRTKERACCNPGGRHPAVNSSFHPIRHRNSSYVGALADKIGYDPVLLPLLYIFNAQRSQFRPAQPATQQNRQCGIVSLASKTCAVCRQQQALALFGSDLRDTASFFDNPINSANDKRSEEK